jgi:hypothetical protein
MECLFPAAFLVDWDAGSFGHLIGRSLDPVLMTANATALRKEQWIQLDTAIHRAYRARLVINGHNSDYDYDNHRCDSSTPKQGTTHKTSALSTAGCIHFGNR